MARHLRVHLAEIDREIERRTVRQAISCGCNGGGTRSRRRGRRVARPNHGAAAYVEAPEAQKIAGDVVSANARPRSAAMS
jgi:hypothetical protein